MARAQRSASFSGTAGRFNSLPKFHFEYRVNVPSLQSVVRPSETLDPRFIETSINPTPAPDVSAS